MIRLRLLPKFLFKYIFVQIGYLFNLKTAIPYKINFDVTMACNSFCKTCDIWNIYRRDPLLIKSELKVQDYEKTFKSLSKNLFFASFEGGEPFLRKDLSEIVISCIKNCRNLMSIVIATNGSMTTEITAQIKEILSYNSKVPIVVAFSLDGSKEKHDEIRGIKNGFDKLVETISSLKALKNSRLSLTTQTTLSNLNISDIDNERPNIKNLEQIYTIAHKAELFKNREDETEIKLKKNSVNSKKLLRKIIKETRLNSITTVLKWCYLKLCFEYIENEVNPLGCFASFATLSIDPYGNVAPCAFMKSKIGTLKTVDFDFKKLLLNKKFMQNRILVKKGKCPHCWMNCDALPTIIHRPFKVLLKLFRVN